MTTYKIEKGIPLPKPRSGFPLKEMEVQDSFVCDKKKRNTLNFEIQRIQNEGSYRFKTRTVQEKGKTLLRVWRVA